MFAIVIVIVVVAVLAYRRRSSSLLSFILHEIWTTASPILHLDGHSIPGPRYTLPQGQGREKILTSRQASKKWQQEYGSIYRIWNGAWPEIILTHPKDVEAWFSGKGEHFKAGTEPAGCLFSSVLSNAIGLINGGDWRTLRRKLDAFVNFQASNKLTGLLIQRAQEHVDSLAVDSNQTRQTLLAVPFLQPYPFFTTIEVFYGALTSAEREEMWSIGLDFLSVAGFVVQEGLNRTRFTRWLYSWPAWRALRTFEHRWATFNRRFVQERAGMDLPIVQLWGEINGGITEKTILSTFTEAIFANLDVTTFVLGSSILHIANNEAVQQRLCSEIEAEKDDLEGYIRRQDTFLHRCVLEGIRLEPIPAFSLAESCSEDKVLGGYVIPAGTNVVIDATALNISNPFWGPDGDEFRPDRFESLTPLQLRYNLSTFGYGARKCLGLHLGGKMVRALVVALFQRYIVRVATESRQGENDFARDKNSFFSMFDAKIELENR
ncbi:hypothetical protein ASPZODRAFT_144441 [Penicilliopsis zonata CBS 506.65]|uniref:ABC transmembrane type-2 domain-containing protein n=1 Tax=Penicilliopsis zonata CBS 506.65 TaxID=1073090 RepID=A0A1L9SDC8_9EURO|nr:hypothetical protein ASPZODRAFT_144441 [Penicilliopsis zonata CBS 506.65]OJJ45142.1 hypothetical protein ASPZODRAFT_144441 [Penicilliopsis zonata CBS 506.65]